MIAVISRATNVRQLARYLHGPGPSGEHTYGGQVGGAQIGGNTGLWGDSSGHWWRESLQAEIDLRPDITKPIWHMTLYAHPEDRVLSDQNWQDIAQGMGESMGWSKQPWALVRNAIGHVHVVVSRVNYEGKVWNLFHDYAAAQRARKVEEVRWGLHIAPTQREGAVAPTRAERAAAKRTGMAPGRQVLAERVRAAATACAGLGQQRFEATLGEQGVLWRLSTAANGRVYGYAFALEDLQDGAGEAVWFKASQLDRDLAWPALAPLLEGVAGRSSQPSPTSSNR